MNHIVFDLEATCWNTKGHGNKNEIIEIGAVKLDDNGQQLDSFQSFVKPTLNPQLSDFCTELTSITQAQVDPAPLFPMVCAQFKQWIEADTGNYWLCSWGHYDYNQLWQDCTLHQLPTDWLARHMSIKHQYAEINNCRPMGMAGALRREKLELVGTHHRGIDDARNIANIYARYMGSWRYEPRAHRKQ